MRWKEQSLCEWAKVCPCTIFCEREALEDYRRMAAREAAKESAKLRADAMKRISRK